MRSKRRIKSTVLGVLSVLGMALWIAAPVVAIVLLTRQAATAEIEKPRVVDAPIERNEGEIGRPVAVLLRWDTPAALLAPAWEGLVQSVPLRSGMDVADGTPVAVVDGVTRVAAVTSLPFARPIERGDNGDDVAALNEWLRKRGYDAPESRDFTRESLAALRAYAQSIGVPGARTIRSFDPAWLVFLPAPGVVAKVSIQVAAPAPSAGDTLATLAPALSEAALSEAGSASYDSAEEQPDAKDATILPTIAAGPDEKLQVSGTEIALSEDRQHVAPDALATLGALVARNAPAAPAVLNLAAKDNQWVVPAASVVVGARSTTCVHVRSADGYAPVPVDVMGVVSGQAVVEGTLNTKDDVAVYPPNSPASCD